MDWRNSKSEETNDWMWYWEWIEFFVLGLSETIKYY